MAKTATRVPSALLLFALAFPRPGDAGDQPASTPSAEGADAPLTSFRSRARLGWREALGGDATGNGAESIDVPVTLLIPGDRPNAALVEALLDWRREAVARSAPALPFPSVLRRVAGAAPRSLAELRAVDGVSEATVSAHGAALVALVERHAPRRPVDSVSHPAVVLVHGSGGVSPGLSSHYGSALLERGLVVAIPDSFTPRGVRTTGKRQGAVTAVDMLGDAYALLNALAGHPRIDPGRIAIVGFSKGGAVTLLATDERIRKALAEGPNRFALHVAFYPYCGQHLAGFQPTGAPVLLLLGGKDSYTPAAQCDRYVRDVRAASGHVERIVYPDAHHAWDAGFAVRFSDFDYSYGGCDVEIAADGRVTDSRSGEPVDSAAAGRAFIERCATPGVWIGRNERAAQRSFTDLLDFVGRLGAP